VKDKFRLGVKVDLIIDVLQTVRATLSSAQGTETSRGIQRINIGTRIQEWKYYAPSRGIQREERMGIPMLGEAYILISNYPVARVRRYLQ
jgi:hypothetical protein